MSLEIVVLSATADADALRTATSAHATGESTPPVDRSANEVIAVLPIHPYTGDAAAPSDGWVRLGRGHGLPRDPKISRCALEVRAEYGLAGEGGTVVAVRRRNLNPVVVCRGSGGRSASCLTAAVDATGGSSGGTVEKDPLASNNGSKLPEGGNLEVLESGEVARVGLRGVLALLPNGPTLGLRLAPSVHPIPGPPAPGVSAFASVGGGGGGDSSVAAVRTSGDAAPTSHPPKQRAPKRPRPDSPTRGSDAGAGAGSGAGAGADADAGRGGGSGARPVTPPPSVERRPPRTPHSARSRRSRRGGGGGRSGDESDGATVVSSPLKGRLVSPKALRPRRRLLGREGAGAGSGVGLRAASRAVKPGPASPTKKRKLPFGFFSGATVVVVPRGVSVTRTKLGIWQRRVKELGGVVFDTPRPDATHVVIDASLSLDDVEKWWKGPLPETAERHVPNWLVGCFTKHRLLDKDEYHWEPLVPPTTSAAAGTASGPAPPSAAAAESGPAHPSPRKRRRTHHPHDSDSEQEEAAHPARRGPVGDDVGAGAGAGAGAGGGSSGGAAVTSAVISEAHAAGFDVRGFLTRNPWLVPVEGGAVAEAVKGGGDGPKPAHSSEGRSSVSPLPAWEMARKAGATIDSRIRKPKAEFFACQRTSAEEPINLNGHITKHLDTLVKIYDIDQGNNNNYWRHVTYKKAVGILKRHPRRIMTEADLRHVKGLGEKTLKKVREIMATGSLRRAKALSSEPKVKALLEFSEIWGVGPAKAVELYKAGFRTVKQLQERGTDLLTAQQLIGLARHDDLQLRIPRSEMQEIEALVRKHAGDVLPGVRMDVCGSYRRGAATSGDIDILFSYDTGSAPSLKPLCARLREIGFLTDDLVAKSLPEDKKRTTQESPVPMSSALDSAPPRLSPNAGPTQPRLADPEACDSWMGVVKLPGPGRLHRRMDMRGYPASQYCFATLYFTGSDHFNRSLRLYARRCGLTLSDKHLCLATHVRGERIWEGGAIPCHTEEDVFKALGLQYKSPRERNCVNL